MAIELFTGKPGAGKTHHAVQRALAAIAEGRPVYVSNMNGMQIAGAIPFEDPRKWEDLPAGSLLIVDEAQRYWRASRSLELPPEVAAMETHRHLGVDFLLTTQQPTYLLKHLRGLIMPHTHHERLTKASSRTFRWQNRCVEDPESQAERELSDEGVHVLTKAEFSSYTSTEKDTHKPKIPKKLIVVGVIAVTVVGMFWWVNKRVSSIGAPLPSDETSSVQPQAGHATLTGAKRAPQSDPEFFASQTPRHPGMPWSAPVFAERKVVSKPEVYCMTSGPGVDAQGKHRPATHVCITEQGTRVDMSRTAAADLAVRGGIYNPWREPVRERGNGSQGSTGGGQRPPVIASADAAPVGAKAGFGDVASYGGIGVGATQANPVNPL